MRRSVLWGAASGGVLLLAASCASTVDDAPVPTTASAPFACGNVPVEGVELILGREDITFEPYGRVAADASFSCHFEDAEGGNSFRVERDWLLKTWWADEELRETALREATGVIDSEVRGEGMVYLQEEGFRAGWICGETLVDLHLLKAVPGRDGMADLDNYMTSILPWMCEDLTPDAWDGEGG